MRRPERAADGDLARRIAVRDAPARVNVRLRQLPLAVLMVGLTATTLWSLGQAIVQEPEAAAAVASEEG